MKNKKITLFVCLLILLSGLFCHLKATGKKPFSQLNPDDISYASVQLIPPDKTGTVTDIEELVSILNNIVIYGEDNSYDEYAGQTVTYTITLTSGNSHIITAYNPFIIIDGIGYKTKYDSCEQLSNLAKELIQ